MGDVHAVLFAVWLLGGFTTFLAGEGLEGGVTGVWERPRRSLLRLRGGYVITERILAARVKLLQEHNAEQWSNRSRSSAIFPWHTWQANQHLQQLKQSSAGWAFPGSQDFIGLSYDQAERFEAIEEEIQDKYERMGVKERRELYNDVIKTLDNDPRFHAKLSNFQDDLQDMNATVNPQSMQSYEKYLKEKRASRVQQLLDEDDHRMMRIPELEDENETEVGGNLSRAYRTVHKYEFPDIVESNLGATFEFVESDRSAEDGGSETSKLEFSTTSDDLADVLEREKHYAPDKFPIHGFSMKANSKFEGRDPLLDIMKPQGRNRLKVKKGYGKEDLMPGGKMYEMAVKMNNGRALKPGQLFLFPSKYKKKPFCLDPAGSGCIIAVEDIPDPDAATKAKKRREKKLRLYMERIVRSLKKEEKVHKCVYFLCEGEGLPMGWICRASSDLRYRSYIYKDGQEFLELDEAKRYANLSRLEKVEYSFQRTTQVGNIFSSYATIDLKNTIPVSSSIAGTYGPHFKEYQKMTGGSSISPDLKKYFTSFRRYFDEEKQSRKEQEDADLVAGNVLKGIRARRGQLNSTLISSSSFLLSECFVAAMNQTNINIRQLFDFCTFGMPDICSLSNNNTKQTIFSLRSHLWRILTATLPTSKPLWEQTLKTWRLTHQKIVMSTCQEVDFGPHQLFRPDEWESDGTVTLIGDNSSNFFEIDDLVKERLTVKDLSIATDQRWKRQYANPGLTLDSDGLVVIAQQLGANRSLQHRWRDFFAAQDLWHAIEYDTWNGTYPQLHHLMPDEHPGSPERMRELQQREMLGIISTAEAEELYWLQEMHYDCVFGIYPGMMLPEELVHVVTRIIYTYIRLHPEVEYTPDMHHLLAPVLWICMRDPEEGARDGMASRERSVKHRRLDQVEADALSLFLSLCGQFLRHWGNVPGTNLDVVSAVARRVEERIHQTDPELGERMFKELGISAEKFVSPWVTSLFSRVLPLWHLLPLWEALLASEDRSAFLTDVCVAFVSIPEVRTRAFFCGAEELLLHLLFPPAVTLESIFLTVTSLRVNFPVLDREIPALMRREEAMREAARERAELVRWGNRLVLHKLDNNGTRVKHIPYVNADGSEGFRLATGGGGSSFGYAKKPWRETNFFAKKFTEFRHIIPRLRLLGHDRAAPLAGTLLVQAQLAQLPCWTRRETAGEEGAEKKLSMTNFSLAGDCEEEETNTLISEDSLLASVRSTRWRDVGEGRVWNAAFLSTPRPRRTILARNFRSHVERLLHGEKSSKVANMQGRIELQEGKSKLPAAENSGVDGETMQDADVSTRDDFNLTASLFQIPVEDSEQPRPEVDEQKEENGREEVDVAAKEGQDRKLQESEDMYVEESRSGESYEGQSFFLPKYRYHRPLEGEHDQVIKEMKEEYLRSVQRRQ